MFYQLKQAQVFNGKDDYIDISGKLHHFLTSEILGMRVRYRTKSSGYCTIFGIYYKESLLPDFSVNVNKGYLTVTTKTDEGLVILSDRTASNDGQVHELILNGDGRELTAWVDGRKVLKKPTDGAYCRFGYVGFATIGRGTLQNQYASFYEGEILEMELSDEAFPVDDLKERGQEYPVKVPLFEKGMAGVENYRIPTLLTTASGCVIACADARMEAPGDNPNHIARAVRISHDSGNTWEPVSIPVDFGGTGKEDGAAAIDGQLLLDDETGTVFMLYGHTKNGIGSVLSRPGSGFDPEGNRVLYGTDGKLYRQQPDGSVTDENHQMTGYHVDAYDRLYLNGEEIGSVCHGEKSPLRIYETSFLQIVESRDNGETWSKPKDLNSQVKKEWMCFLGPGPGIGICMREKPHKGRLVSPVYFSNSFGVYTCAVIYSDDHGRNWQMGKAVNDGRVLDGVVLSGEHTEDKRALTGECQVVELPGGILKFFIRNPYYGHVVSALSRDGGENWMDFTVETKLPNPDCQFSILKTKKEGKDLYLFSGPDHDSLRVGGTVRISMDDTGSWGTGRLLEAGEFAYSCMAVLPDGSIGLLYEGLDITLYFTKFPIDWVEDSDRYDGGE